MPYRYFQVPLSVSGVQDDGLCKVSEVIEILSLREATRSFLDSECYGLWLGRVRSFYVSC